MCVGNTMQDMMKPKVISNPASAAPPPLAPPPIPITTPSLSESKSTDQTAPGSAMKKSAKKGNPLRIDLAGSGVGGGSGINVPL